MRRFPMRFFAVLYAASLIFISSLPSSADSVPPSVSAKSAVVIECDSGNAVWSKNSDERLPMASTTKIMTALVAIETCDDITRDVVIDPAACGVEGSSIYLKAGETLSMEELLYALMLESANDAACAIAIEVAGSVDNFAVLMNDTAKKLGLENTHFTNPHGLDDEDHYTTAYELARLTAYALSNPVFAKIVSTKSTTIPMYDGGTRYLTNHNKLLQSYDGAIGVKTGFTKKCGRCLVSAAERDGVRFVAVTLSAPDDWDDHTAMLDFGFTQYRHTVMAKPGDISISIPVTGGTSGTVTLENRDTAEITLPSDSPEIWRIVEAPHFLYAPVNEGDPVGYARFYLGTEEIARLPLYVKSGCAAKEYPSFWERILQLYK